MSPRSTAWTNHRSLPAEPEIEPNPHLQQVGKFIAATGADIHYGGDRACYVPSRDLICVLPPLSAFRSPEQFRATELHELAHWSGAASGLTAIFPAASARNPCPAEELVAELTAAFLCAHLGVTGELRHAGYIDSWLTLLRGDRRAIFTAASKASQAADYLRAFSEQETRNEAA
ncbi:MAG: zincin-like metallopeptidase domain-containing protein [Geminicoccaceae bacterium]